MNHGEREHAVWSASATSRNWACSGALALGATVESLDIESEAAAWGTACHELAEVCLISNGNAANSIGVATKTKRHEFVVDEEMADTAQQYVDYVRAQRGEQDWLPGRCQRCGGTGEMYTSGREERCNGCGGTGDNFGYRNALFIEQRFSLAKLNPPFDAGGTCDAIIYNPDEKLLEVVDLKGGRGIVVEVTENKQLRTYALGALLANPGLDVRQVRSTIVQPRAPHKDGRIRSETFHVADLIEWTAELLHRMELAKTAETMLAQITGELSRQNWGDVFLVAGDHCTFCPAAAICPKLEQKALATANAFFNDNGAVAIRNQPSELDPSRIAQVLDGADLLTGWLNAVRALATRMAETGADIPGYQLVDTIGHRKFKRKDYAADDLTALGLTKTDIFEQKLRSPAQMEKKLGGAKAKREIVQIGDAKKTREEWFNDLVERPVTGRSLVSSAKTTKPAVKGTAEAFFS